MNFETNRPSGFAGAGDKFLVTLSNKLLRIITNCESGYRSPALRLESKKRHTLAGLLIEFAEDLHHDIGFWRSYENYNIKFFNTPLPFAETDIAALEEEVFHKNRIKHFLWQIYNELKPDYNISPKYPDFDLLAEKVTRFLQTEFPKIPKDSGIKKYLAQPNTFGWDVKRKLVWAATRSYLFRLNCINYVIERNEGIMSIPVIDDFICQENTIWSGLGVIDILAETLDIAPNLKEEVKSWYKRHLAYYKVVSIEKTLMVVTNLINNTNYNVMLDGQNSSLFKVEEVVFGSLVPYDNYWYWSGEQRRIGSASASQIEEVRNSFILRSPRIVYRYDKNLLAKALESLQRQNQYFISFFEDDLVIFPDGETMAEAMQKQGEFVYEKASKEQIENMMKKHNLKSPSPRFNFGSAILEEKNGVAVYFNPDMGIEILTGFNDLLNGFAGLDVKKDDNAFESLMESMEISPNFVHRILKDFDKAVIEKAFFLDGSFDYSIDFLLRKYKGHFYRKTYPLIAMV